ncbi:hypothetical protein XELAEV_18015118mg [Xenopus laevis]|uniref:Uncharacterized protein n=1 Tax=Xenopus laevis TaxID=8355 RepID=A0A974DJR5_XENLA|nr:hypothetical protein XELAEV_18015118mg [Xenopus laevis]
MQSDGWISILSKQIQMWCIFPMAISLALLGICTLCLRILHSRQVITSALLCHKRSRISKKGKFVSRFPKFSRDGFSQGSPIGIT